MKILLECILKVFTTKPASMEITKSDDLRHCLLLIFCELNIYFCQHNFFITLPVNVKNMLKRYKAVNVINNVIYFNVNAIGI
jgi:hypothetical protein